MYSYFAHIYYGLFRTSEIVKIKIKHVDLKNGVIDTDTKTGDYFKQIPKFLMTEFYSKLNISSYDPEMYLFTKDGKPDFWTANDKSRQQRMSEYFKEHIKDDLSLNLDKDHTTYSFRHAAIGKLFQSKIKEYHEDINAVEKSLDYVRGITLHKSNDMVRNYLREIGYFKIEDWSDHL